jgi:4-diphosphocytidyl-2-C-methyl-D-erythritol kinase
VTRASFTLPSFAKINWSLRVLGKRSDGYHEIRTVLQTVSLHDKLHFSWTDGAEIMLTCDQPDLPTGETNLIIRAARLLREYCQVDSGARLHLQKKIPPQGGLGGGSSNAAVALLGLAQLWQLEVSSADFHDLGKQLGADVPFFFVGGMAWASGIGNELNPLKDCDKLSLIIITPGVSVSTREAYSALNASALTSANSVPILASSRAEAFLSELSQWPLHNDFESVIFEIEPEIKRVYDALLDTGAQRVLLAGSGSSVFGIFDSAEAQRRALDEIQTETAWRIFPCNTLSRGEYLRDMGSCGTPLLRSSILRFDFGA